MWQRLSTPIPIRHRRIKPTTQLISILKAFILLQLQYLWIALIILYFTDEKTSFENLIYQLFEFIQVLKEKNKFKATIKKAIDELCYFAILYMQINDDQVDF